MQRAEIVARAAEGQPGEVVDCELGGVDLSGLDLAGWQFRRCGMKAARFVGTVLDGAVFELCRGAGADFAAARLGDGELRGCDFNNASFAGAVLTGARIVGCRLTGADWVKAGTIGVMVEDTLLVSARLR
ncbi:MAG: pentapeptide repeat-containing protein, partial [Pseudorhodobacter sp.]|nr:pentapeptide repeat-containing protein [Pseudorhodobacter sp.]